MTNLFTLPHLIAGAHDKAQASKLREISDSIQENNQVMRQHYYPVLHEIEALLREHNDSYDLTELSDQIDFEKLNEEYQKYRGNFLASVEEGQDPIEAGNLSQLFPEDLSEVSLHQLKKIEGQIKEMLDNSKNFNSQSTQDLYLMIQIGVALLTSFQKAQEEMTNHGRHVVRSQRS